MNKLFYLILSLSFLISGCAILSKPRADQEPRRADSPDFTFPNEDLQDYNVDSDGKIIYIEM